jgi:hypothetical protein
MAKIVESLALESAIHLPRDLHIHRLNRCPISFRLKLTNPMQDILGDLELVNLLSTVNIISDQFSSLAESTCSGWKLWYILIFSRMEKETI